MKAKLTVIILYLVTALLCSCKGPSPKVVLSIWDTNTKDRVYSKRNRQIKQAFIRNKIDIRYEELYLDAGYRDNEGITRNLSSCLDSLEKIGHAPDIILSYGNICNDILLGSKDVRLNDIPTISFGVTVQNDSLALAKSNIILIKDTICLKENLQFMEDILHKNFRAITPLDWTSVWMDDTIRHNLSDQIDLLDSTKYFNGMMLSFVEEDLQKKHDEGKNILYTLSIDNLDANRSILNGNDLRAGWAFNPSSGNALLMLKHDEITTRLESNPHTQPYFTGIAGAFGVWDNCIGGYFAPFENQLEEIVGIAEMIFSGTDPSLIPTVAVKCDYYANWKALKEGHTLSEYPSYIHFINAGPADRSPEFYKPLLTVLSILGWILAIGGFAFFVWRMRKAYLTNMQIREKSYNAIDQRNNMQYMIKHSTATLWSLEGSTIMYDGARYSKGVILSDKIAQSNEYFRIKLNEFFANNLPGSYSIQIPRTDEDGKEHWYEIRMFIEDGRYGLKKSGITINIDEQKQMEREIHEAYRLSSVANEREKFISTMSHEMRTPLNSIVGFSQILSNPDYKCSEDELKVYGKAIEENNNELMKIIEDMLAITHMDNANIKMNLEEVIIKDFISNIILEYTSQTCQQKNISYTFEVGPSDACIRVDQNLFSTILKNIISNAVKFSTPGSAITIGWREGIRSIVIYVSDKGIGISKPDQENIFNRFYQVDNFTQGTGLGLALAKEYAEKMNGRISVDSSLGEGSTFSVRFEKIEKEVSNA